MLRRTRGSLAGGLRGSGVCCAPESRLAVLSASVAFDSGDIGLASNPPRKLLERYCLSLQRHPLVLIPFVGELFGQSREHGLLCAMVIQGRKRSRVSSFQVGGRFAVRGKCGEGAGVVRGDQGSMEDFSY